jgi:HEAT repeat protein
LCKAAPGYFESRRPFADLLGDPDKAVRAAAAQALGKALSNGGTYSTGEVRAFVRLLDDEDPALRASAYGHLGLAGEKAGLVRGFDLVAPAVPAVIRKLGVEPVGEVALANESNLLCMAVRTVGKVGRRSPDAVPALLKVYARFPAATERDAGMRGAVVDALGEIGPFGDKALPFLAALVRDEKLPVVERARAAQAVGRFGPPAAPVVPDLVALLKGALGQRDPPPEAADRIIGAFAWLGAVADPAVPLLLDLARGPDDDAVTRHALRALGDLGPVVRERAAPVLAKLHFAKGEHRQADRLVQALVAFGDTTTPLAVAALKGGDVFEQEKAVWLLRDLGPDARSAVPELKRIAGDENTRCAFARN